jgi:hypothetical protein
MPTPGYRKIIRIGYRYENVDGGQTVLDARGEPIGVISNRYWATFVFWLPAAKPYVKCSGETKVLDVLPHELQALKDGEIEEYVQEFEFPNGKPPDSALREGLMPVWSELTRQNLGYLPADLTMDTSGRAAVRFTAIDKPELR